MERLSENSPQGVKCQSMSLFSDASLVAVVMSDLHILVYVCGLLTAPPSVPAGRAGLPAFACLLPEPPPPKAQKNLAKYKFCEIFFHRQPPPVSFSERSEGQKRTETKWNAAFVAGRRRNGAAAADSEKTNQPHSGDGNQVERHNPGDAPPTGKGAATTRSET